MAADFKNKGTIGAERRAQLNYNEQSKSQKDMAVVAVPVKVLTAAQATAGAQVGKGNLCRIFGTAADLVRFSDDPIGSLPVATDQDGVQLGATVVTIVATGEFIRTTAAVTRVEVIED